jgi:HK97 family phage major capsid protein
MEGLARADLAKQIGLAMDRAALHGLGSSNQPTGIYAASNVNSVAMGGVPTFGKLIDMASELGTDNALQGNLAFLTTPGMAGKLAQTVVAASTDTRMIWEGSMVGGQAGRHQRLFDRPGERHPGRRLRAWPDPGRLQPDDRRHLGRRR